MTQLDSQKRDIGGHTFEVFMLPPLVANDVLVDLGKVFAPALGKAVNAIGAAGKNPLDADLDDPKITAGIAALADNISKEKMRELIRILAGVTHCDGTPLPKVLEMVFRGDLTLLYKWLWFALEVNFKNFIDWLGSAITDVTKAPKAAQSPATSKDSGQS